MRSTLGVSTAVLLFLASPQAYAQSEAPPPPDTLTAAEAPATNTADLLSDAELQTLVAPVALYPDTLLIQILVAATQPIEVIKSQRFLLQNTGTDPAALKDQIEAQGWDPSVAVLATAFPDVITDMAEHIDWTETVGDAMLAQDDDVLAAVQVMRKQALESGALVSGAEQTVEASGDTVVIQPTNPEVVYVPQYVPAEVYQPRSSTTDMLIAGAIGFGTYALMDNIFDSGDDWNGYWGCRNCGGWNGAPIVRNPNIDIDRGDITIDRNKVNIGNGNGNLANLKPGDGWQPNPDKAKGARDKIAANRSPNGSGLTLTKTDTNALRADLANRSAAPDISRPGAKTANVSRPGSLPPAARANALRKTGGNSALKSTAATGTLNKATGAKPAAVKRPSAPKKAVVKPGGPKASALKKNSSGPKAAAASQRGRSSVGKRPGGGGRGRG